MIEQFAIAIFGITAVWLSQSEHVAYQKYASVFGLIGQPFWFYSSVTAEQWGIFILCIFYTLAWYKGFYRFWIKQDEIN